METELGVGSSVIPATRGASTGSECDGELKSLGGSTGTRVVTAAETTVATASLARDSMVLDFLSFNLSQKEFFEPWLASEGHARRAASEERHEHFSVEPHLAQDRIAGILVSPIPPETGASMLE